MPNFDPWLNQSENDQQIINTAEEISKLENHLLPVRDQNQKKIKPDYHPT